jgi:hypothetical protein
MAMRNASLLLLLFALMVLMVCPAWSEGEQPEPSSDPNEVSPKVGAEEGMRTGDGFEAGIQVLRRDPASGRLVPIDEADAARRNRSASLSASEEIGRSVRREDGNVRNPLEAADDLLAQERGSGSDLKPIDTTAVVVQLAILVITIVMMALGALLTAFKREQGLIVYFGALLFGFAAYMVFPMLAGLVFAQDGSGQAPLNVLSNRVVKEQVSNFMGDLATRELSGTLSYADTNSNVVTLTNTLLRVISLLRMLGIVGILMALCYSAIQFGLKQEQALMSFIWGCMGGVLMASPCQILFWIMKSMLAVAPTVP